MRCFASVISRLLFVSVVLFGLVFVGQSTSAVASSSESQRVPPGRHYPEIACHVSAGPVLVLSDSLYGDTTRTQMLTRTNSGWVGADASVMAVTVIHDGAIVNDSDEDISLITLDPEAESPIFVLGPGENVVVNAAVSQQYSKQCICKCGQGWVSVGNNPPCGQFNGQGPCIDPTCSRSVSGFSDCRLGWGPKSSFAVD